MTNPEGPERFWWQVILARISRTAGSVNSDILADRSHGWTLAIVELYGSEAPNELIVNYMTDSTGRLGHQEAARRQRHLEMAISDGALTAYKQVRLVLEEISGEFDDTLYLRDMDAKILRWQQIRALTEESAHSDTAALGPGPNALGPPLENPALGPAPEDPPVS